jgi:hypothetical protein
MKATQQFSPITIVIETEKEANVMWHVLNQGFSAGPYLKEAFLQDGIDVSLKDKMWKVFNDAYRKENREV